MIDGEADHAVKTYEGGLFPDPVQSPPDGLYADRPAAPAAASRRPARMGRPIHKIHSGDPICWAWQRFTWPRGMSPTHQMRLLRQWHGKRCGICNMVGELVIDHDHRSGWVRGLLCDSCNRKEGISRVQDDVYARWRACPPAAILGVAVVYESGRRGVAIPLPGKATGPLFLPEWAPPHRAWPPEPWLSLDPTDDDPVSTMTRDELVDEVRRWRAGRAENQDRRLDVAMSVLRRFTIEKNILRHIADRSWELLGEYRENPHTVQEIVDASMTAEFQRRGIRHKRYNPDVALPVPPPRLPDLDLDSAAS